MYLFNDKATLDVLVCDHSPVYLTIEAKLGDKLPPKLGTSHFDLFKIRELSSSGKVLSGCML